MIRLGHPAVEGIAEYIARYFAKELAPMQQTKRDRIKQCIGHMIRQIMESQDYEKIGDGVCHVSTVFNKGAKYHKIYSTNFDEWTQETIGDDLPLASYFSSLIKNYTNSDEIEQGGKSGFFRFSSVKKINTQNLLIESDLCSQPLLLASEKAIKAYLHFLDLTYGEYEMSVEDTDSFKVSLESD
ncbi:MAG: hypothetical protein WBI82_10390 [Sphaerochaeta sp.]